MKKIFILLFIFLCCGCSAKYEISFVDDSITDSLLVRYKRNNESLSQIDSLFSNSFYALGRDKLYHYINNSDSDSVSVNFSYTYNVNDYVVANIPNNCFTNFNVVNEDKKYYFFVDGAFKCGYYAYEYLDSLDIVISTNHVVYEHNSDEQKNGKYIWHVDPNTENFSLRFVVSESSSKSSIGKYLLYGLLSFVLLFIFYFVRKFKLSNEV